MREIFSSDAFRLYQGDEELYLIFVAEDDEDEDDPIAVRLQGCDEDDGVVNIFAIDTGEQLGEIPRDEIDNEILLVEVDDEEERDGEQVAQPQDVLPNIPENIAAMQELYDTIPWGRLGATGDSTQTFNLEVIVTRDFQREWNLQSVTLMPPPSEPEQPDTLTTVFAWSMVGMVVITFVLSVAWLVMKLKS